MKTVARYMVIAHARDALLPSRYARTHQRFQSAQRAYLREIARSADGERVSMVKVLFDGGTICLKIATVNADGLWAEARPARALCRHGHVLSADNVYVRPTGQRCCRTCRREERRALQRAYRKAGRIW